MEPSDGDDDRYDQLLRRVLAEGTDDAIADWIAGGPASFERLRLELAGERRVELPPGTSDREAIDNLSAASHAVAGAYPDAFLAAFDDPRWSDDSFVCAGLGAIHQPRATRRLMRLLVHDDKWLRVSAAAALRGHRHRGLRAALRLALDDSDELVRYHAAERLRELDEAEAR